MWCMLFSQPGTLCPTHRPERPPSLKAQLNSTSPLKSPLPLRQSGSPVLLERRDALTVAGLGFYFESASFLKRQKLFELQKARKQNQIKMFLEAWGDSSVSKVLSWEA